jgi:hypothetical protein
VPTSVLGMSDGVTRRCSPSIATDRPVGDDRRQSNRAPHDPLRSSGAGMVPPKDPEAARKPRASESSFGRLPMLLRGGCGRIIQDDG